MTTIDTDEIQARVTSFIVDHLLGSESAGELDADSPLLEWGVLNSMNTARLLTFIREELHVSVPPTAITGRHFRSINTITSLVRSLLPTEVASA
ncbi:acyl carrier protein [Catellatospora bangladeshensis]|uniref:Carrier domain-containing protein n=1 Tax=Catellatospora bangladeshensis TaxID=310355 RepID=A0A8J3NL47_9ACTN|nr:MULTISPECIES: phosphopantetheine-binding protein [Catellatospora]BCJ72020.1 hypothetical protein CS0771_15640 [Catellatospora sp. IY07-71]GIF83698.1 hypothetical protein Cba03nite_50470 [Catellatospora bangladeshensis]